MIFEVRLAFVLGFFALWALLGLLPWVAASLWRRGRGVMLALPLAIAGGAAGGVTVPLAGADDARGFLLSLGTAFLGGALACLLGIRLATTETRSPSHSRPPTQDDRPDQP
ncbi:MAG: hypothetical protein HYS09_03135 [Chloroflexi bacterium]|nr:hypothetical protein [Chloroflexota bacterium]